MAIAAIALVAWGGLHRDGSGLEAPPRLTLQPEKPYASGYFSGVARLWTCSSIIPAGLPLECFLEFECQRGATRIRYPLIPENTFRIFVFNENRDYIGESVSASPIGVASAMPTGLKYPETVHVPGGGTVGICVSIATATETTMATRNEDGRRIIRSLGPGQYVVQGVFTTGLFPAVGKEQWIRSNWLHVNITEVNELESDGLRSDEFPGPFRAVLTANRHRVAIGDHYVLRVRCVNQSARAREIFDPFTSAILSRRSAELRVFDENGQYLGEHFNRHWGSVLRVRETDWILTQPGGFFGTRTTMVAGTFSFLPVRIGSRQNAPTGLYEYQLSYLDPDDSHRVIALSEKIKIEFIEQSD